MAICPIRDNYLPMANITIRSLLLGIPAGIIDSNNKIELRKYDSDILISILG